MKKGFILGLGIIFVLSLVSCNTTNDFSSSNNITSTIETDDVLDDSIKYAIYWLDAEWDKIEKEKDNFSSSLYNKLKNSYTNGINKIKDAKSISELINAKKEAHDSLISLIPRASGDYDYSDLSDKDKANLFSVLENYIVETRLSGFTLYENVEYAIVNPRIKLKTKNNIADYGFGILEEGSIDKTLDTNYEEYKYYYHTPIDSIPYTTPIDSMPYTANYLNDRNSVTKELYKCFSASLFKNFLGDDNISYKLVGELSKDDRPIGLDSGYFQSQKSKRWRTRIKTGADGLKYNTLSNDKSRIVYKDRLVEPEDYLSLIKVAMTQSNNIYLGAEVSNSVFRIEGLRDYYLATKDSNLLYDDELWDLYVNDNLKIYKENDDWYLEWNNTQIADLNLAISYAPSYLPLPMDFIELVGVDNLFSFNMNKTLTPVDNSLSLGGYVLEAWNEDNIIYKKNPNYVYADSKYQMDGIVFKYIDIKNDEDAIMKEFLNGNLDYAKISSNYLKEYMHDSRTIFYSKGGNFKLDLNTLTYEDWEYYFGENGLICKTDKDNYWEIEPAMNNDYFIKGLSYSLNRKEFADIKYAYPSFSYLDYFELVNSKIGLAYNLTDSHEKAISKYINETDGYGYNLTLAKKYFKMALAELEALGKYERGTKDNPTIINIEIAWMYQFEKDMHNIIKKMFEDAFNDEYVSNGCYKLNIEFWASDSDTWSDVYYKKLMVGQYDIGFGCISNSYNVIDSLMLLSANQGLSYGFTLNWATRTDKAESYLLLYDGVKWAYDELLSAAKSHVIITNDDIIYVW